MWNEGRLCLSPDLLCPRVVLSPGCWSEGPSWMCLCPRPLAPAAHPLQLRLPLLPFLPGDTTCPAGCWSQSLVPCAQLRHISRRLRGRWRSLESSLRAPGNRPIDEEPGSHRGLSTCPAQPIAAVDGFAAHPLGARNAEDSSTELQPPGGFGDS